jgi:tRNA-dihydrouridine synthase A
MIRKTSVAEITVKCRLGVTGRDSYAELLEFVEAVRSTGLAIAIYKLSCFGKLVLSYFYEGIRKLYVHARKCELKGLSPAQNRNVPPLNYDWVYSLVDLYPEMLFTLNGNRMMA